MAWKWGGAPTPPTAPTPGPTPLEPAADAPPAEPPAHPPPPEEPAPTPPHATWEPTHIPGSVVLDMSGSGGNGAPQPGPISPLAIDFTSAPRPETLPTEPLMSADSRSLVGDAIPLALSLFKVQIDNGTLDNLVDTVGDAAVRAARLATRGKLDTKRRDKLCEQACDDIKVLLPEIAAPALQKLGEIVIDVLDEHTDTGPLEEVDGEIAKRGLAALVEKVADWRAPRGNLQARALRARERAARQIEKAEQLEALAALKS